MKGAKKGNVYSRVRNTGQKETPLDASNDQN